MLQNFKIHIYRFPNKYLTISLKTEPSKKILEILEKIKSEVDPTLKVDINCRHSICGSCAIKVNGQPVLACKTSLSNFIKNETETVELILEPLSKNSTKGDLQTDFSQFYNSFNKISEYLLPKTKEVLYRDMIDQRALDSCIKCGICFYQCPVNNLDDDFAPPAVLNKQLRFIVDKRDFLHNRRLETANDNSYQCIKCFQCTEFCPKNCSPAEAATQTHSILAKSFNHLGQIHSHAILNSILNNGKMKESDIVLNTLGFFGSLQFFPSLVKAIFQGNFSLIKKSKNLSEIKKLIKIAMEKIDEQ